MNIGCAHEHDKLQVNFNAIRFWLHMLQSQIQLPLIEVES